MKGDFQVPQAFVQALRDNKSFLLVSHVGLDGDHLGSMLALQQALTVLGKKVVAYLPESIPSSLSRILFGLERTSAEVPDEKFDAVIALECPTLGRMPKGFEPRKLAPLLLNFDHHQDNENYGDINWVLPEVAALGEMTFEVIHHLDVPLDRSMATALYVAVLTDTGSFQYSRVTPATHRRLASMVAAGVATDEVSRSVYRNSTPNVLKLLGRMLNDLTVDERDGVCVAWAEITQASMDEYNVRPEEIQFFVDELDRVEQADVVVLVREAPGAKIKASIRSRNHPINQVAALFGGGGHSRAAGVTTDGQLSEVRKALVDAVHAELTRLTKA
ncbi:bifunctional oligoribonuclease/PAP phosphatase NrnA [bacterium]|nr:bifunctional oligoribonuclease/PAP phosphatase NrnA [bacterium]